MDVGRHAYSSPCRFLRDADSISRVEWMDAAPDAKVLNEPCVILSKYLEPDPWFEDPIGELPDRQYTTTLRRAPAGTGRGHVCGAPEDFDEGGLYEPDLPPVAYGAYGLPLCCDPPKRTRGGAAASARATIVIEAGGPPPPVGVSPSDACGDATPIVVAPWSAAVALTFQPFNWIRLDGLTVGVTYRITVFEAVPDLFVSVLNGAACPSLSTVVNFTAAPFSADWTQTVGTSAWVLTGSYFATWTFWVRPV